MELPLRPRGTSGTLLGVFGIYNIPQVIEEKWKDLDYSFPKSVGVFLFTLLHLRLEDAIVSKRATQYWKKKKSLAIGFNRCETKLEVNAVQEADWGIKTTAVLIPEHNGQMYVSNRTSLPFRSLSSCRFHWLQQLVQESALWIIQVPNRDKDMSALRFSTLNILNFFPPTEKIRDWDYKAKWHSLNKIFRFTTSFPAQKVFGLFPQVYALGDMHIGTVKHIKEKLITQTHMKTFLKELDNQLRLL